MTTAHWSHVAEALGLQQDGRRLARTYAEWLAPLPLSPLMVVQLAEEGAGTAPCGAAQRNLLALLPERVTAAHWARTLLGRCRALASAAEFTLPGSWQRRFELLELRGPFLRVQYGPVAARERATPAR